MPEIDAEVRFRTVPLSHPLVVKYLALNDIIMLHRKDRRSYRGKGTHYTRFCEDYAACRWYIRQGKGRVMKTYLTACEIVYINSDPTLFLFRTEERVL